MRVFSNRDRPFHLGPYPLERLPRTGLDPGTLDAARRSTAAAPPDASNPFVEACRFYARLYEEYRTGAVSPAAPYPEDPEVRARDVKGLAYFFDSTLVGVGAMPESGWLLEPRARESHVISVLVECGPLPRQDNPVAGLLEESRDAGARLRATEIAIILGLYLRRLGFDATAHTPAATDVSLEVAALACGIARWNGSRAQPPFVGERFALAAVTTSMTLAEDRPLAARRPFEGGVAWWIGTGGTETWWNRKLRRRRSADVGPYPMEKLRRADDYTTLILHDEVPRLPKRVDGFVRAEKGDFGPKARQEVDRFWCKTPFADATKVLMWAQWHHQDGPVSPVQAPGFDDPARNARAVKAVMYHLGADIVGSCAARPYTWYSHQSDGTPIDIYHSSAVVCLIDQGFETMEGASGDDWVSGTQSARAYLRGAQIAGVLARTLRSLGYSARAQTSRESDVIQTPLVVLAGLGEMSRIGETVLNPFIGPRSKSAVTTTNLPLEHELPLDFDLQSVCGKCMKCARECPCDAITYGSPVMFNGYEQWKQDVQRCTSYRITNMGGSACGRCMKTCPYNNEGLLVHRAAVWLSQRLPFLQQRLVMLDDRIGNGEINPRKRWWQDLEVKGNEVSVPVRINRRGLDRAKGFGLKETQTIGYMNADMIPSAAEQGAYVLDRASQIAAGRKLEMPDQARARHARGEAMPPHYRPASTRPGHPEPASPPAGAATLHAPTASEPPGGSAR